MRVLAVLMVLTTPVVAQDFNERWPFRDSVETYSVPLPKPRPEIITIFERSEAKPRRTKRGGDVCARHNMHRVVTRGGKSWRCRR
jgi:hypothetical protein